MSETVEINLNQSSNFKYPIYGGIQIDNEHAILISKNPENQKKSNLELFLFNIKDMNPESLIGIEDYSLNDNEDYSLNVGSLSSLKINNKKNDILVLCAAKKDKINGFLYFFF